MSSEIAVDTLFRQVSAKITAKITAIFFPLSETFMDKGEIRIGRK